MFKFFMLLLLPWTVQGDVESEANTRIVGGKEAKDGSAPYQISLTYRERHFCGGSIINNNWTLTAAHCTSGLNPKDVIVKAGTNSLSSGGVRYNVNKIVNHEKYSSKTLKYDIALMQIKGVFTFNRKVNYIKLASRETGAGVVCLLTGWGYTDNEKTVPDKLQMLPVKTLSTKECNRRMPRVKNLLPIDDSQICTFNSKGRGGCQGDSGGPLINEQYELVGVVSWGIICARGYPDVFTDVYDFKDWINDKISK